MKGVMPVPQSLVVDESLAPARPNSARPGGAGMVGVLADAARLHPLR
jgi:hypothetical protein